MSSVPERELQVKSITKSGLVIVTVRDCCFGLSAAIGDRITIGSLGDGKSQH